MPSPHYINKVESTVVKALCSDHYISVLTAVDSSFSPPPSLLRSYVVLVCVFPPSLVIYQSPSSERNEHVPGDPPNLPNSLCSKHGAK